MTFTYSETNKKVYFNKKKKYVETLLTQCLKICNKIALTLKPYKSTEILKQLNKSANEDKYFHNKL